MQKLDIKTIKNIEAATSQNMVNQRVDAPKPKTQDRTQDSGVGDINRELDIDRGKKFAGIKPGDIIAFSGRSWWSRIIRWWTRSVVSHVGIVLFANIDAKIIEATTLDGYSGVVINKLSERVKSYEGTVWWLPVGANRGEGSAGNQPDFNTKKFVSFLMAQTQKKYDRWGAVRAGVDFLDRIPLLKNLTKSKESFRRLYCSELAAGALEAAGVLQAINASEVTPKDLCKLKIFAGEYKLLAGKPRKINGYNTREGYSG